MTTVDANPARLVHLQLLPLISGVQKVTLEEFTLLDRGVFEPLLVCKEAGALSSRLQDVGVASHYASNLVRPISPVRDLTAAGQLLRLFKALRPAIVHTHSSKTGILGRIAGRLAGVPVVMHTVHGYAFPYASSGLVRGIYFAMEYLGGKLCDALVVLNEADRDIAINRLRVPAHKVYLIPNGVDTQAFGRSPEETRAALRRDLFGVESDEVVCIGMVGRLWRQKNPACLLDAARRVLAQTDRPVKFFFIGDGELRGELEQGMAEHGLQERVTILGWRDDVPRLLSALDLFVLPSRWEGMPLAILEAMASSVPVVASDISGNRDLVSHGEDGFLFDSENDEQLAERLLELVEDPARREAMARNAREKVESRYPLGKRIERMAALYKELLRKARIKG
jgi:glycosyltransferase involved in cell wall biosynthesis